MTKTKMEWADSVWNPVTGCTKISEGCENCYAETICKRWQNNMQTAYKYRNGFKVTCHPEELRKPLSWKKGKRIFVCSMADLFHDDVPFEFIAQIYGIMSMCPEHTFMILTKRPERALKFYQWCEEKEQELYQCPADQNIYLEYLPVEIVGPYTEIYGDSFPDEIPLENIWVGVTAENQARADERIPTLLQIPAAVRFVSVEPMLEPVDLTQFKTTQSEIIVNVLTGIPYDEDYEQEIREDRNEEQKIDWVICGGESGPNARPMHPDWARSLRDQCESAKVPFFFKQWGEWFPDKKRYFHARSMIFGDTAVFKIGKKASGREVDGKEHLEYPEAKP